MSVDPQNRNFEDRFKCSYTTYSTVLQRHEKNLQYPNRLSQDQGSHCMCVCAVTSSCDAERPHGGLLSQQAKQDRLNGPIRVSMPSKQFFVMLGH